MALNRERPHLLVLPEDDATRNIAIGFSDKVPGPMQILNPAGGWGRVREELLKNYLAKLRRFSDCHLVVLIDFDDDFVNRIAHFQAAIPADVANRVYVVGAFTEAETLKNAVQKKLGKIGEELAAECEQGQYILWNHPQIVHNIPEIQRLHVATRRFLF